MTVSELMNKLLDIRISPNTEIAVSRETEPMIKVKDVELIKPYDSNKEYLVIYPEFDKEGE